MSARVIGSGAILVAAVAVCAHWWAQYIGKIPRYSLSDTQALLWLLAGPFVPALSVRVAIAAIGSDSSDAIFRIWVVILAGVNTTVSGVVLDIVQCSSRTHAVFSRFLLVLDLLGIFWVFSLFSPDMLYQLWHTNRSYLFNSVIFSEMTPHIAVNVIAVGVWADKYLPLHLGIASAFVADAYLFYIAVKAAYTPAIRKEYRRSDGNPTIPDDREYVRLRKSVE